MVFYFDFPAANYWLRGATVSNSNNFGNVNSSGNVNPNNNNNATNQYGVRPRFS